MRVLQVSQGSSFYSASVLNPPASSSYNYLPVVIIRSNARTRLPTPRRATNVLVTVKPASTLLINAVGNSDQSEPNKFQSHHCAALLISYECLKRCRNRTRAEATSEPIGDYNRVSSSEGTRQFENQDDTNPSFSIFDDPNRDTRSIDEFQDDTTSLRATRSSLGVAPRGSLGHMSNTSPLDLISEAAHSRAGPSSKHEFAIINHLTDPDCCLL